MHTEEAVTGVAIREILECDNFEEYRDLFRVSECLINIGKEQGDADLISIGTDYVQSCFEEDLASWDELQKVFGHGLNKFWVLVDVERCQIIGSIALECKSTIRGELRRMCVSRECRRKGYGSRLVQHLLRYCGDHGITEVFLSTPVPNIPGISLYKQCGFHVDKTVLVTTASGLQLEIAHLSTKVECNNEVA